MYNVPDFPSLHPCITILVMQIPDGMWVVIKCRLFPGFWVPGHRGRTKRCDPFHKVFTWIRPLTTTSGNKALMWECEQTMNDVITWKQFPQNCTFVRGMHKSPVDSPYIGQITWCFNFFFLLAWTNKMLNKQPSCQPFETPWCTYDIIVMCVSVIWVRLTSQLMNCTRILTMVTPQVFGHVFFLL